MDVGLVSFRWREYSPTIGRWLTNDPIGYSGNTANLAQSLSNNPIGLTDPLGLEAEILDSGTGEPPTRGLYWPKEILDRGQKLTIEGNPGQLGGDQIKFFKPSQIDVRFLAQFTDVSLRTSANIQIRSWGARYFPPGKHDNSKLDFVVYLLIEIRFRRQICTTTKGVVQRQTRLKDAWEIRGFRLPTGVFLRSATEQYGGQSLDEFTPKLKKPADADPFAWKQFLREYVSGAQHLKPGTPKK